MQSRAEHLLTCIFSKLGPTEPVTLKLHTGVGRHAVLEISKTRIAYIKSECTGREVRALDKVMTEESMTPGAALIAWVQAVRGTASLGQSLAKMCLEEVSGRLSLELDRQGDVLFTPLKDADVTVLRRTGSKRSRPVPLYFKQAVLQRMRSEQALKNPAQVLAMERMIARRRLRCAGQSRRHLHLPSVRTAA